MKENFWNKKIPSLLGIILIIIGIGATTILVKQEGLFSIKANPSQEPKDVRISNITDNSFTVSYWTIDDTTGVLNYGNSQSFGQSGLDDRDQESGNVINHKIHNITVRNLNPTTKYYFAIISGKDTYTNNSIPFEVTTGSPINTNPLQQDPMTGKIILPTGNTPKEAILLLTTENAQIISTLVKKDGTYILPLNSLRNNDLSSYFKLGEDQIIKLLVFGDNLTSNVILSANQIRPVPTITLSSNFDFTSSKTPVASSSATTQSFPSFSSSTLDNIASSEPKIITPLKDQGFSDQQPQFKGTTSPNETVEIIIHSDEQIKTQVQADSKGNWTYRPDAKLSEGQHTITIVTKNAAGVLKTITQSFVVYASGSQIEGAVVSPIPTQILTLTPTIEPSLTITPSLEPSQIQTLTETPTQTQTPTITSTIILTSPSSAPLPPTGNPTIITAGIIGLLITLIGGLLFLLSRGSFAL